MKKALLTTKVGMTQIFAADGTLVPVTVLQAAPNVVTQVKTMDNDGYEAVQVGYGEIRDVLVNKPRKGHFAKAGVANKKYLKEFRLDDISGYEVGATVSADVFAAGDKVDVTGITKGRGYTGAIKRWNLAKLRMTHGVGPVHRQSGSMGVIDPARIFKNKKMAGQYGNEQVTVLNLNVVKIDKDNNIIAVKGAIPGARGGIVVIRDSVKA